VPRTAVLFLVALIAVGCGSSNDAAAPGPIKRHLVYERLVGEKGVWIADTDGGNPRLLVPRGHSPVISPDGSSVAYVGDCDAEDVCHGTYVISTAGGKPRRISSDTAVSRPFIWSPDSKRLVVTRGPTPFDEDLVSINVSDGTESRLAKGRFYGASFSPDAKEIVYSKATSVTARSSEGAFDLFVVGSDGGAPKQITDTGDGAAPVWGPKSIAFAKLVPDRGWGRNEIWQVQPDGSGRRTITGPLPKELRGQGFTGLMPVDWSDDGNALLAGWANEWGLVPVAVDPADGKSLRLVEDLAAESVAISRDGRFVLASRQPPVGTPDEENATVVIVPEGGGKPTVVARGAGSPSWND